MGPALTAFAVVFVAELGDRTQLLLFGLATRHRTGPIVAGLVAGYATTTVLGVLVGAALGAALPDTAVRVGGGLAFLGFAVWTLLSGRDDDGDDEETAAVQEATNPLLLAGSIAGALFLSELGDKSQLATATLAAEGDAVAVAVGALLGILASGGLGVVAGRLLADRIDPRVLRWVSAALFAVFGVVMLLRAV